MFQRIGQRKVYIYAVIAIIAVLAADRIVRAEDFAPGSQQDPIVTQSYVEQRNEQLKYYFEQKLQELEALTDQINGRIDALQGSAGDYTSASLAGAVFEVVEVPEGRTLVGYGGTEIVLRGGSAIAVQSSLGGLSDLTGARDIGQGQTIPDNHLLLIPRSDGRGIKTETECVVMVKGKYDIK